MDENVSTLITSVGESKITLIACASVVFGIIKLMVVPSERTAKSVFIHFFICMPVGTVAGGLTSEQFGGGVWLAVAVASTASFLAENILLALNKADWWALFKEWFERKTQ